MSEPRPIPENLAKYEPEILAGLAAAARRRGELGFQERCNRPTCWGGHNEGGRNISSFHSGRPVLISQALNQVTSSGPGDELQDERRSQAEQNEKPEGINHQAADLPTVRFWPIMGINAARVNHGGAWKIYVLAKNLDLTGRGAIPLENLIKWVKALGVHPKTFNRWLGDALALGLITERARHDGWVVLASNQAAAVTLGCNHAGGRPASITAAALVTHGWRAQVFAAYEETHGGRPISRAKQESLTGVPISTQRAYDNQAGVIRKRNIAISEEPVKCLEGAKEFENRAGPFPWRDKRRRYKVLAWWLPDNRTAPGAESLQRGRTKKINKAIKHLINQRDNSLFIQEQAQSYDGEGVLPFIRIFQPSAVSARSMERKIIKADIRGPGELYFPNREYRRGHLWNTYPLGGD